MENLKNFRKKVRTSVKKTKGTKKFNTANFFKHNCKLTPIVKIQ